MHYNDHTLLLDPFADTVWIGYSFPKGINADAIFSTHPHYDHDGGIFRNLKPYWEGQIPFYQNPGNYENGPFKITGIKGKHSDPYGKEFGQKNTIFIFEAGDLRIAHWGDNAPINDMLARALNNIDILLFPIDDTYHILSSAETEKAISIIQPKIVIPMHYKIAELEHSPGNPKNLGTIDEFIKSKTNITVLTGNQNQFKKDDLPDSTQYLVFQHAPYVSNWIN